MRRALLSLLLLALFTPASVRAQAGGGLTSVRENPAAHPALQRRILVDFDGVTVEQALAAVAELAGFGISYSRDALPSHRIRLGPAELTAGEALVAVLAGTELDALVSAAGNVAVAPAPARAVTQPGMPQPARNEARGRVTDRDTSSPLTGVFVVLVDESGVARSGVLSGDGGWYRIQLPGPGAWRLRYEMLGYATHESEPFTAAAAAELLEEVRLAPAAISLESIRVAAADTRCRLPRDVGAQTYGVWEEARKALAVAAWAERDGGVAYQVAMHEFSRDIVSGELLADRPVQRRITSGVGRAPFVSAPAEELTALGFVRALPEGGYMYYGLDAATLLSPEFLESYCFRVRLPSRDSDVVGLHFEPVSNRSQSDITGVLWLDRGTLALRSLEYSYTRHPGGAMPLEQFGGRVAFRRLANGAWIISDWWIRMPETGSREPMPPGLRGSAAPLQVLRAAGLTVREAGGVVHFTGLTAWAPAPAGPVAGSIADNEAARDLASVRGVVFDSTRMAPLRGATVFVAGSPRLARTDAQGRFEIAGLPAGEHRIGFLHPRADSLALAVSSTLVLATAGAARDAALHVPAAAACPQPGSVEPVAVIGFVLDPSGTPAPNAAVMATWLHGGVQRTARTNADGHGRFLLCGVPVGVTLQLEAGRSRTTSVQTHAGGIIRQDLVTR